MSAAQLTQEVRQLARAAGFSRIGVCPAVTPTGYHHFLRWIENGYDGEMNYLRERADAYSHPRSVLDGCRSVVAMTLDYRTAAPSEPKPGEARISRYAWGTVDYHDWIHRKLKNVRRELGERYPEHSFRGVVDTAPLLERDFARLAGLGWQGKNTMLISRDAGSWFFLAFLLTDAELVYDRAHEDEYCGTCQACLDACPTDAFAAPYVLDARKCISYLTIELRGTIPVESRAGIGDWLFGCDICQEVCPWNRFATSTELDEFQPLEHGGSVDAIALLEMSDDALRVRFRKTPLWRTKRQGLLRNAAIVLGNTTPPAAKRVLLKTLFDSDEVVRASAVWALRQYRRDSLIETALRRLAEHETSVCVRAELDRVERGGDERDNAPD